MTHLLAKVPHLPNRTNDYMAYWEGFLSPEEINQILSLPEWHNVSKSYVGGGDGGMIAPEVRKSDNSWLFPQPHTQHIWDKITLAIAEVNRTFFNYDIDGCYEAAQLTVYAANDTHYDWHIDAHPAQQAVMPRKLSMSLLLSDPSEFEGGEFQVKTVNDTPISLEQVKGRAWFFSSNTLHRVTPVTRGVRRSLVLWIGGPPFK